jgi:hypothetical protein
MAPTTRYASIPSHEYTLVLDHAYQRSNVLSRSLVSAYLTTTNEAGSTQFIFPGLAPLVNAAAKLFHIASRPDRKLMDRIADQLA